MNECSDGQALRYLGFELMQKFNILSKFKVLTFKLKVNFLFKLFKSIKKFKDTKFSDAKFLRSCRSRL